MSTKPLKKGNLPISKVIPSTALFGAQTGQRTLRVYKPRPEHPLEECLRLGLLSAQYPGQNHVRKASAIDRAFRPKSGVYGWVTLWLDHHESTDLANA